MSISDTLYCDKPVLLNRDKHRHRRIRATPGFSFARNANSLYHGRTPGVRVRPWPLRPTA